MQDQIISAFKKASRIECELVKALEDLERAYEEAGHTLPLNIQGMIDQLDDDFYDIENHVENLVGEVV